MNTAQSQKQFLQNTGENRSNFTSNRVCKMLSLIGQRRHPLTILDVGCFDGILRDVTHQHHIFGADITSDYFHAAGNNGYKDCAVVNLETDLLPFPEQNFDMIVMGECIEHLADTDFVLGNINRRLKPGGELILTFPNIRTPIGLLMFLLNIVPMFGAGYRSQHVKDFTTKIIKTALRNNGFKVKRMIGSDFCVSRNVHGGILSWLATYIPSWSSTVIVHAVKDGF